MTRLATFASYGLIAAGLAIMPIGAFAGSAATSGADAKAPAATTMVKPATTPAKDAPAKDAKVDGAGKTMAAPSSGATAGGASGSAGHAGATQAAPAKAPKVSAAPVVPAPNTAKTGG